jgi:hypothetical protein
VHVAQCFAQRGKTRIGENRRRQPILGIIGAGPIERQADEQAQASLGHPFGARINWREMLFRGLVRIGVDAAVFRMHEFQALRAAARLAEAAHARAARQTLLLLGGEVEKTQRQESRTIRNLAQHLAASAECHLGEQHFAFDGGALPGPKLAQRHHAGAIFIAQGQQEQQVLG